MMIQHFKESIEILFCKCFSVISAESFCGKGRVFKGIRRHARMRMGIINHVHCHYFVRLEEGKPPEHYYLPHPQKPHEQLANWLESMRKRKITNSL